MDCGQAVEETAPAENEIGEVTIEDITEEQEEQNEALEESEAFDAVEPVTESQAAQELDNILDNMINRERSRDPESEVIADIITDVSEEINLASESEEHDHDESQMVSQASSEDICFSIGVQVSEDPTTSKTLKIIEIITLITGRPPKDAYHILDLMKLIDSFPHPNLVDGVNQRSTGGTIPVDSDLRVSAIVAEQQYSDLQNQLIIFYKKLESETSQNAELRYSLAQLEQQHEETLKGSLTSQLQLTRTIEQLEQLERANGDLTVLLENKNRECYQLKVEMNQHDQAQDEREDALLSRQNFDTDKHKELEEFMKTQVAENRTLRLEICQLRRDIREATLRDY